MAARILRLFLILCLLLAFSRQPVSGSDDPEKPYRAYLPLVASGEKCTVVYADPPAGIVMRSGTSFDARWIIQNTGAATWQPGSADIRFTGGDRLHSGSDVRDIPFEITPGGKLDFVIPMTAPQIPGVFDSNWEIRQAQAPVCRFSLTIRVVYE